MFGKALSKAICSLLVALACLSVFCFYGCGDDEADKNGGDGISTTGVNVNVIFLGNEKGVIARFERTTEGKVLTELMEELQSDSCLKDADGKAMSVSFITSSGAYGTTIDSYIVGGTSYGDWTSGKYVMLYTTVSDIRYISVYDGSTIEVEGVTYNSCGYGAEQMPIINGETYVFGILELAA